ncbi:hypothetical protein, partial [Prevotella sp. MGM1]|uniref:hypothetical protein n=1 Tax=Prevotella sp. MGM1 TaxID=2033405 RepID=UPI001E65467F
TECSIKKGIYRPSRHPQTQRGVRCHAPDAPLKYAVTACQTVKPRVITVYRNDARRLRHVPLSKITVNTICINICLSVAIV